MVQRRYTAPVLFALIASGFALIPSHPSLTPSPASDNAGAFYRSSRAMGGLPLAWGADNRGQLGIGSLVYSNIPVTVHGLTDVTAVAAGQAFSLALKRDGTVWAWGTDQDGELGTTTHRICQTGNGQYSCSPVPIPIRGLHNMTAIAAGTFHALALRGDGTVWSWGANDYNQLGHGSVCNDTTGLCTSFMPQSVRGLSNVIGIAAGGVHSLALTRDGMVWGWGDNSSGQLGNGTRGDKPVPAHGLSEVVTIAAGGEYSLALRRDGTVWAWGDNSSGQLGNGTFNNSPTPQQVHGLDAVIAIAAGSTHSVALRRDGTVWAWGDNFAGVLGIGSALAYVKRATPVQVQRLSHIRSIAAGAYTNLAIGQAGTVWAWGQNHNGELGTGHSGGIQPAPVRVRGLRGVIAVAAGEAHSLAFRAVPSDI